MEADEWIAKASKQRRQRFDYTKVKDEWQGLDEKVSIRCVKHDLWFKRTPKLHLRNGPGCPLCRKEAGNLWVGTGLPSTTGRRTKTVFGMRRTS